MVKIPKAEQARRSDRMMELLARKTVQQTIDTAIVEFKILRRTAQRYVIEAQKRVQALVEVPRSEWIADTLLQLDLIIRKGDVKDRLVAIAQRTALLGLQSPARVHVVVEGIYRGPEQLAAMSDPRLRQQALALEASYGAVKGNGNGDPTTASDAASKHVGEAGHPGIPAPRPPSDPPEGGFDATHIR